MFKLYIIAMFNFIPGHIKYFHTIISIPMVKCQTAQKH